MRHAIYLIVALLLILGGFYFLSLRSTEEAGNTILPKQEERAQELIEEELDQITSNMGNLAKDFDPFTPFTIERVWVDQGNFYVEYKNKKGTLGQLLVIQEGERYWGVGYFSPSESGWVLQAGEGEVAGPNAILYEKDEQGEWKRQN